MRFVDFRGPVDVSRYIRRSAIGKMVAVNQYTQKRDLVKQILEGRKAGAVPQTPTTNLRQQLHRAPEPARQQPGAQARNAIHDQLERGSRIPRYVHQPARVQPEPPAPKPPPRIPSEPPGRQEELPSPREMMAPEAPAAKALSAFTRKVQVPRWSRAMLPGVKPAKSVASHPLVELLGAGLGTTRSTASTATVTSPLPEYDIVAKSVPSV